MEQPARNTEDEKTPEAPSAGGAPSGLKRLFGSFEVDRAVFLPSTAVLAVLVIGSALAPDASQSLFQLMQDTIVEYGSWYYVLVVAIVLVSVLIFSLSRFGDIKLGPDHSTPDYGNVSWFAMLFAAGMGIGLMFFGVAEPVMHFLQPPQGEGGTAQAAGQAMSLTYFHWGLHAWAIYAIVALLLAYFAYRHNLPLTVRSAFYPLIGERIFGPIGAAIDVFAIVCTSCGIATSLGVGVLQINNGLAHLTGIPVNAGIQVLLICITMGLASISVALGLDSGIKRLSELNIAFSVLLLVGVLLAGPTILILAATIESIGIYMSEFVGKTFTLYAYEPTDWLGGWTIFYWGWWLSWSPFVGLFIARISRGRTIREFTFGAILVPCGYTLLWMGVFGNSAIDLILNNGQQALADAVAENQAVALFRFLEYLPFTSVLAVISLVMVVVFFVTSADSGALVLNMLSARGRDDTPLAQRIFWAVVIGAVAAVLLVSGGLASLQTAAIASALPFSLALLGAIWGFARALSQDADRCGARTVSPILDSAGDWRARLDNLLSFPRDRDVRKFLRAHVRPALEDFAVELRKRDIDATVREQLAKDRDRIRLEVLCGGKLDFVYEVRCRAHPMPREEHAGEALYSMADGDRFFRAEVHLAHGGQDYCVMGWTRDQITHDVLSQYENHLQFLQSMR